MVASATNVQYMLGSFYDDMGTDKVAIVAAMILRAQNYLGTLTGTSSGGVYDNVVEDQAAAYCLIRVGAGGQSASTQNIGLQGLSVSSSSSTGQEIDKKLDILLDAIKDKIRLLGIDESKWVID